MGSQTDRSEQLSIVMMDRHLSQPRELLYCVIQQSVSFSTQSEL